jgi:hypothetical protein
MMTQSTKSQMKTFIPSQGTFIKSGKVHPIPPNKKNKILLFQE